MISNVLKKRVAIVVGVLVLAAGVVAGRERPTLELVQERAPRPAAALDLDIDVERLRRGATALPQKDPFASREVAAQTQPAAKAAEKPSAPPLPFQYFGRLTENGKTDVFVMRGDELITVAEGKTIGEYRVDKVGEKSIAFTYLPLKTKQKLEFQ